MSIKDDLHRLVGELPEAQLRAIERLLRTAFPSTSTFTISSHSRDFSRSTTLWHKLRGSGPWAKRLMIS